MVAAQQQFIGTDPANPDVQMLVTIWEDGTATIAYRDLLISTTWGPPHDLTPVP
jgi:hypothetical protein